MRHPAVQYIAIPLALLTLAGATIGGLLVGLVLLAGDLQHDEP